MKHLFLNLFVALMVVTAAGCYRSGGRKPAGSEPFVVDTLLPTTPVKDQGGSSLCWIYAMLATIETDHLCQGDSVNLSPDYLARMLLDDEATRYFLSHHQHHIAMRGMATGALHLMNTHGMVPFDAYHAFDAVNYGSLARRMELSCNAKRTLRDAKTNASAILDEQISPLPRRVFMLGAEYSFGEFARSLALPHDYEALTSFTHHPFGESFVLETPDNTYADKFTNVHIDTLVARIYSSLRHGRAVCWEGDTSEKGFSVERGVADIDIEEPITQALRQRHFETLRTTDDHCMAIVGTAHDRRGKRFFIMKNSYGKRGRYRGFIYVSEDYVRLKTIAIVAHRQQPKP